MTAGYSENVTVRRNIAVQRVHRVKRDIYAVRDNVQVRGRSRVLRADNSDPHGSFGVHVFYLETAHLKLSDRLACRVRNSDTVLRAPCVNEQKSVGEKVPSPPRNRDRVARTIENR